ncbi:MAG: RHS repeat-associated core domain-containing protein [Bryobacteraceae bacterium]
MTRPAVEPTNFTAFDTVGNVTASNQVTAGQTYSFAYGYNLAGALTSETYPSGRVVNTTYDGADRPYTLSGIFDAQNTNYITQTSYWPNGGIYFFVRGNNIWHAASYNNRLQQTESYEAINNSSGAMLLVSCPDWGVNDDHNVYDICPHASGTNDNGTLQSNTEFNGGPGYPQFLTFNQSFSYDNANRLISAGDSGGWSRNFAYDQYGNMWVTGAQGVGISGNMPTMDMFNSKNQVSYFSYDAAGNLLSVNGDTAAYDAENRMTSAYDPVTHNTETYLYDGSGQRVEKTGPAGTTVYVYDAFGQLTAEYSTTQNTSPCTTCYPSYDYLGSVRLVTDQNGSVVARHDYLPFGEEVPANTAGRNWQWGLTTDTEQKFTGQIRDNETGMDYFNARYFTNALGRFNSPDSANKRADPTNPQTWNAYAYAGNNPLANVDPTGMDACDPNNDSNCVPDPDTDPGDYARYVDQQMGDNQNDPMQGTCIVDGAQVSCGMALNILDEGAAVQCPNNVCAGWETDSNGNPSYVTFQAFDDGTSGYYTPGLAPQQNTCSAALSVAKQDRGAIVRANAYWSVLSAASERHSIAPSLLGAIGVRESGFRNVSEIGGGFGRGVFQLTVKKGSGVTEAQAFNVPWAATFAANMLSSNSAYLASHFPSFTSSQLLQATAASYNIGRGGISGNPNTIDVGTRYNNYGSNVVNLMTCF